MSSGVVYALSGMLVFVLASISTTTRSDKSPQPNKEALAKADATIRQLFREDYIQTDRESRRALAQKMLRKGLETKDDVAVRYVFLREAREIAVSVGDIRLALDAIAEIDQSYDISTAEMSKQAWNTVIQVTSKSTGFRKAQDWKDANNDLATTTIEMGLKTNKAGKADEAKKYLVIAEAAFSRVQNAAGVLRTKSLQNEIAVVQKEEKGVALARAWLSSSPDDAEAMLTVGKFLCFTQNQWQEGLPLLEKCSDTRLRELAKYDRATGDDMQSLLKAGDGWFAYWETKTGAKGSIAKRAAHWYWKVLPKQSPLQQVQTRKKLMTLAIAPDLPLDKASHVIDLKADGKGLLDSSTGISWEISQGTHRLRTEKPSVSQAHVYSITPAKKVIVQAKIRQAGSKPCTYGIVLNGIKKNGKSISWLEFRLGESGVLNFAVDYPAEGNNKLKSQKEYRYASSLAPGEWNTMLLICADNKIEAYLNGILVIPPTTLAKPVTPIEAMGSGLWSGPQGGEVELSEIRIWDGSHFFTLID